MIWVVHVNGVNVLGEYFYKWRVRGFARDATWNIALSFGAEADAIDAAKGWVRDHPGTDVSVWEYIDLNTPHLVVWAFYTDDRKEYAVEFNPEIAKPLNIGREALVTRLQENLDAEVKERETLEARERAARITVQQFVTDHEDEIVQWIGVGAPGGFGAGSWEDVAKNMERFFEDNDYKPKSAKKSKRENELEKFVRVLGMATDSTVEVQPNQPIYSLL